MFGGKHSQEQDLSAQYDARQGTLFPLDHPPRPDESLKLHHYLIGGLLVAAMLGVLITGYFYSRSLVIKEPKEDTTATVARPAAPAAQPAPPASPEAHPAPAKGAEASLPPQAAPAMEKAAPKQEAAAEKKAPPAKPETPPKANAAAGPEVYFIQLAAFKDPHQTAQLCKQIEPLGFKCYFGNVDTADGRYWRLRTGPYEAKDQAENDLAKLRDKGFDGRLIPLKKSVVKAPLQLPL